MPRRQAPPEGTVGHRVWTVRTLQPPDAAKPSKYGYPSQDDFARIVGAARLTVRAWEANEQFPDEINRERLAELSSGRYMPDDFAPPAWRPGGLEERLAALEARVTELVDLREADQAVIQELRDALDKPQGFRLVQQGSLK